jgi:hypothetical protein
MEKVSKSVKTTNFGIVTINLAETSKKRVPPSGAIIFIIKVPGQVTTV